MVFTQIVKIISLIKFFFDRIENVKLSWKAVFFLTFLIIAVRIVLETHMSLPSSVSGSMEAFIFFESWFLALFLALAAFISYISGHSALKIARLFLFGLPIILIPAFGEGTAVLYGYFSQNLDHISIPSDILAIFAAFFILLCFFLPVKDLKDFKGDSADGVRNFLTVFGWRKGKLVIAIMLSSGYLIFSYLTQNPVVIAFSFIFAVLGVFFVIYYEKLGEFPIYLNFLSFTIFISIFLMLS